MVFFVTAFATWSLWNQGAYSYAVLTALCCGASVGMSFMGWINR